MLLPFMKVVFFLSAIIFAALLACAFNRPEGDAR